MRTDMTDIQQWVQHPTLGLMRLQEFRSMSPLIPHGEVLVTYADHHAAVVEAVASALAHGLVEGAMVERERIRQAVDAMPDLPGLLLRSNVLAVIDGEEAGA